MTNAPGPVPPGPMPYPAPAAPASPPASGPRRPRLWPWVVALVGGIMLASAGIGLYVATAIAPLFDHTARSTPQTFSLQLSGGAYDVFQQQNVGVPLAPHDVTVTGPGGAAVPTTTPSAVYTLSASGSQFQSVVEFDVNTSGRYHIHVANPQGGGSVLVFVAPSLTNALTRGLGWLALVAVGALVALVGLILLIVRAVQRSKRRRLGPPVGARCANGHPTGPADRFCPTCGAPVYAGSASGPAPGPA